MFICLVAFGQEHSDLAISQENNINPNDQLLKYQEFLREETKSHREYTQDYFSKILYILSGLGLFITGALIFLNWKSKEAIKKQVNQRFNETVEGIINGKIDQLNSLIKENKRKANENIREINKLILELSVRSNEINTQKGKNFEDDEQIDLINFKGKKILWVDDYPSNNDYPREILEQAGIKFNLAMDTNQALNILKKKKFDLIISDMERGKNSSAGLELLILLKSMGIDTPTIIFTSIKDLRKFGQEAMKLGALDVITGFTDLLHAVQKTLNKK